jgi:hypothetical protein
MLTAMLITVGPYRLRARLEDEAAPRSCTALARMLPLRATLIQARWSGDAAWVPLGDLDVDCGVENATSYPAAGQLLLYPGGFSETEILFPYGDAVRFASKLGQLAGNHIATVTGGAEHLPEIGRLVLWEGAQELTLESD